MTFSQWWVARIHEFQDEGFEEKIISGPYHSKEDAVAACGLLVEKDVYGYRLQVIRHDFMAEIEDG
jgi:hypothetical protein